MPSKITPQVKLHEFAVVCLQLYKNKLVEINTGEQKTTLLMSDFECSTKDLIRGVVVDAIGSAIIVECGEGSKKKSAAINCWSIISIAEVGVLRELYIDQGFRRNRRAF